MLTRTATGQAWEVPAAGISQADADVRYVNHGVDGETNDTQQMYNALEVNRLLSVFHHEDATGFRVYSTAIDASPLVILDIPDTGEQNAIRIRHDGATTAMLELSGRADLSAATTNRPGIVFGNVADLWQDLLSGNPRLNTNAVLNLEAGFTMPTGERADSRAQLGLSAAATAGAGTGITISGGNLNSDVASAVSEGAAGAAATDSIVYYDSSGSDFDRVTIGGFVAGLADQDSLITSDGKVRLNNSVSTRARQLFDAVLTEGDNISISANTGNNTVEIAVSGLGNLATRNSVTAAQIDSSAVGNSEIANNAVTGPKIAENAVALSDLAHGTANTVIGFNSSGTPDEITVEAGASYGTPTVVSWTSSPGNEERLIATGVSIPSTVGNNDLIQISSKAGNWLSGSFTLRQTITGIIDVGYWRDLNARSDGDSTDIDEGELSTIFSNSSTSWIGFWADIIKRAFVCI